MKQATQFRIPRPLRERARHVERESADLAAEIQKNAPAFQKYFAERYREGLTPADVYKGSDPAALEAAFDLFAADYKAATGGDLKAIETRFEDLQREAAELEPQIARNRDDVRAVLGSHKELAGVLANIPPTRAAQEAIEAVLREAELDDDPERAVGRLALLVNENAPEAFTGALSEELLQAALAEGFTRDREEYKARQAEFAAVKDDEIEAQLAAFAAEAAAKAEADPQSAMAAALAELDAAEAQGPAPVPGGMPVVQRGAGDVFVTIPGPSE